MKKLSRHCPICPCETGVILHHQKFQLNDKSILPNAYDVVSCEQCGFVYADTAATQEIYNNYYAEYSKYEDVNSVISTGGGTSIWDKERLQATAAEIGRCCKKDARVLDIGCANGGLLVALKNAGYTHLFGIDPSKACANYVNKLGIKCYLGELFESDRYLNGEKFDFIILSHVMEHISDVKRAALILRELLSDDGQLYIETPDAGQYARHYIVPYYYFDSEHINHFDRNSLFNLFESAGFNTVQIMSKSFLVNETTRYPAIFGIFKKIANPQPYIFLKDDAARKEIEQYINMSNDTVSNQVLEQLAGSGQPIVVFGAGNFTARLLESTPLKKCNIYAFVDNDVKKHGNTFNNTLIREPAFLKQFKGPVVVCSALFFNQILNQLKNDLQIPNEIITIR